MYNYLLTQNLGSGTDFEEHVAHLLRRNGFSAELTGNEDQGVDIIAQATTPGNPRFLIQCKYQHSTLNLTAVQEVFTGAALRKYIGYPVVFTTSHVTSRTKEAAKDLGVEIISFPEIKRLALAEQGQQFAGTPPTGLAGILYGLATGNKVYADQCSRGFYKTSLVKIPPEKAPNLDPDTARKEIKRRNIEELYRRISQHKQELQNLRYKESQHELEITDLEKEVQLQLLDDL